MRLYETRRSEGRMIGIAHDWWVVALTQEDAEDLFDKLGSLLFDNEVTDEDIEALKKGL